MKRMDAREITLALGGQWHGSYGMAQCPGHDDGRTPALKLSDDDRKDDGIDLHCFAGCDWRDVKAALRERRLLPEFAGSTTPTTLERRRPKPTLGTTKPNDERARHAKFARDLWREARPIEGTVAGVYLASRGIMIPAPLSLRYLANAKHTPTGLILPALLAAVTRWPDRRVVAIQRTFLQTDGQGKAPVTSARMTLGPAKEGATRLAPVGAQLALSEGIEDALSVLQATGIPTWACLGATGLQSVILPPLPLVAQVTIFADADEAGEFAALNLARRLAAEGRQVSIARPPIGKDFNDVLRATAPERNAA